MRKILLLLVTVVLGYISTSCSGPKYLPCPPEKYRYVEKTATFVIQNIDELAKTETVKMVAHYDGFDVKYDVSSSFVVSFEIINNTNKSLLIDKSQCYVLYNGYSTMLFKDVRSSRSTTFNNVQDAINNVQTNQSSVLMTIPPYSKYKLSLEESNLRSLKEVPTNFNDEGYSSVSINDNPEVVEFVIPYSYDYSMAKWGTSRNRIYVGGVNVVYKEDRYIPKSASPHMINENQYYWIHHLGSVDNPELRRARTINRKRYDRHDRTVKTWATIGYIITLPTLFIPVYVFGPYMTGCNNINHLPPCM